jgi:lipopolysaccharide/colanic/teichoic acid biosynthesis glycosyltransferase
MYGKLFKQVIDFIIALLVLIITSPVFLLVFIVLTFTNNGKPFFWQLRPGKNEKIFRIWKFRTMNDSKDENGNLLPDSKRLTAVGKFIRKTSLDELPQLINVVKGDMSLIGPRPLLIKYLPYYTTEERKRFLVRPGISGLAQVNGRNILEWDKRLAFDVHYVNNLDLKLDIAIAWKTLLKIIKSENIFVDPHSIMLDLDEERKHTITGINPGGFRKNA